MEERGGKVGEEKGGEGESERTFRPVLDDFEYAREFVNIWYQREGSSPRTCTLFAGERLQMVMWRENEYLLDFLRLSLSAINRIWLSCVRSKFSGILGTVRIANARSI